VVRLTVCARFKFLGILGLDWCPSGSFLMLYFRRTFSDFLESTGMFLFSARKKSADFQRYMRRLIDLTSPNRASSTGTERFVTRNNRVIPALVCP
jgi:hypothetical protein